MDSNGSLRKRTVNGPETDGKERNGDDGPRKVSLRERMKHFTWAWFNFPLSTGGLANLLDATPNRFPGLVIIGKIVYVFNLVVFCAVVAGICTRFALMRDAPGGSWRALKRSLGHPTEGLFFPTALLNLSNIFIGAVAYGSPSSGPWLTVAIRVLFWIYVAVTYCAAVAQYYYLFSGKPGALTVQSMTPAWILPVFPAMISGTLASAIAADQPAGERISIIVGGITLQGLGWMVAFLMFAVYLHRLIQYGLPAPNLRPGMFISAGPPSFTALALIGMARALPPDVHYFQQHTTAIETLRVLATFIAVFLWALAFWFFSLAALAVLNGAREMSFHLVWWAFVFPNVGFTVATIRIGEEFDSEGILWLGSAMTIALVVMWIFVLVNHVRALWRRKILMPGTDEDRDQCTENDKDHGTSAPLSERREHFDWNHWLETFSLNLRL